MPLEYNKHQKTINDAGHMSDISSATTQPDCTIVNSALDYSGRKLRLVSENDVTVPSKLNANVCNKSNHKPGSITYNTDAHSMDITLSTSHGVEVSNALSYSEKFIKELNRLETSNNLRVSMNILKAFIGTGVFIVSASYKYTGLIVSSIINVFVGLIIADCVLMLVSSKRKVENKTQIAGLQYPQVALYTLGYIPSFVAEFSIMIMQFLYCMSYFLFASDIFLNFFTGANYNIIYSSLIVIFTPLMFLTDKLQLVAFTSMVGANWYCLLP